MRTLIFLIGMMPAMAWGFDLGVLLRSSAYGAGAGAVLGLTALAVSENPSGNFNMVTRGASLGLYAGLAVGVFLANQPQASGDESGVQLDVGSDGVPLLAYRWAF